MLFSASYTNKLFHPVLKLVLELKKQNNNICSLAVLNSHTDNGGERGKKKPPGRI